MTEVIEGTAVEIVPAEIRAVAVVQQPGQSLVATDNPAGPIDMLERASAIATALARMIDKQKLYTRIRDKDYPHVEAWQTVGRMDNVVARESRPPIRHDDGSYEAFVELIRLSDGMVIGGASALCGTKDDVAGRQDWSKQSEPSRRSMAATRAISRAFRGQYAWIMALAGYEPTPAEEMPHSPDGAPPPSAAPGAPRQVTPPLSGPIEADPPYLSPEDGPWDGPVSTGSAPVDGSLRQTPDGPVFGFVVMETVEGRANPRKLQVIAKGELAEVLDTMWKTGAPDLATVWGDLWMIPWVKDGSKRHPYRRVEATRVLTPDWVVPAAEARPANPRRTSTEKVEDLGDLPW